MYQQHLTLLSRFILQCCQWQHHSVSAVRQDVAVLIPVTVLVTASRGEAPQPAAEHSNSMSRCACG